MLRARERAQSARQFAFGGQACQVRCCNSLDSSLEDRPAKCNRSLSADSLKTLPAMQFHFLFGVSIVLLAIGLITGGAPQRRKAGVVVLCRSISNRFLDCSGASTKTGSDGQLRAIVVAHLGLHVNKSLAMRASQSTKSIGGKLDGRCEPSFPPLNARRVRVD